ncbi:MAG TPA: hypothetical protein VFT64_03800 [Rickettsiales bacterium]|nr:hypothetical protein [Rickettsiales bacterium]
MVRIKLPSSRRMRALLIAGVLLSAFVAVIVPKFVSSGNKGDEMVCFKTPEGKVIAARPGNVERQPGILKVSVFSGVRSIDLIADYTTYDTAGMNEVGDGAATLAGPYKGYSVDKPGVNDPNQPGARDVPLLVKDANGSVSAKIVTVAVFYGQPVGMGDNLYMGYAASGKIMKGGLQQQPC